MESHEATYADSHLIELDLDKYVDDFNRRVIGAYQEGKGSAVLPADLGVARSLIPPGTGALRDFSYIAPEIPEFDLAKCVGCMSCVTECPDTAILGKAIPAARVERALAEIDDEQERAWVGSHWARTQQIFRPAGEKRRGWRALRHLHRPDQVQRLRGVRAGVRRTRLSRAQDGAEG